MAFIKKSLSALAMFNQYVGAKVKMEEDGEEVEKTIADIHDYHPTSHEFIVEFTNGDIQVVLDKIVFDVDVQKSIKLTNKLRAKKAKGK